MKIAGMGCRGSATRASLRAALSMAEAAGGRVDALATSPHKTADLAAFAREQGLFLHSVDVFGVVTPTQSQRIMQHYGTGSLAEAAALAAAGPVARLLVPRVTSPAGLATAAIAVSADEIPEGAAE